MELIPGLRNEINIAKKQIFNRNEYISADKIVAELTLGFWVRLLNAEYELVLWKHLRKAFPNMEKKDRQRKNVSAPINKIRNLRNRTFHREPISWNLSKLGEIHFTILNVLRWLNVELIEIINNFDRLPSRIKKAKESGL